MLVFGLVLLASELGLDILLGGFVAGMIVRAALQGHELEVFESKLTAVGFGFLIPFFFVESGIDFDLEALGSADAIAKLLLFFGLFLVVAARRRCCSTAACSTPATAWRSPSSRATELPLVVAITTIAIDAGEMRSSTAAGLVGAAMLSTLIYPFVGLALRKNRSEGRRDRACSGRCLAVVTHHVVPARRAGLRAYYPTPAEPGRNLDRCTRFRRRRIQPSRARSSVGERSLHTREVAGSKPAVPIAECFGMFLPQLPTLRATTTADSGPTNVISSRFRQCRRREAWRRATARRSS